MPMVATFAAAVVMLMLGVLASRSRAASEVRALEEHASPVWESAPAVLPAIVPVDSAPLASEATANPSTYSGAATPGASLSVPTSPHLPMAVERYSNGDVHPTMSAAVQRRLDSATIDESTELVGARLIGAPPQPKFPEILLGRKIEGDVIVRFYVDEQGRPEPSSLVVLQTPHELLSEAVRRVIPGMRFQPARRARIGARAEPSEVQMSFQFNDPMN
jgi:TonB family protein